MYSRALSLLAALLCAFALAACDQPAVPAPAAAKPPAMTAEMAAPTSAAQSPEPKTKPLSMAEGLALAKKSNCLECHSIDKKIVGPAWMDVSVRYKGMAGMEDKLVVKVSTGGYGNWGNMPMPALAPDVKEEDIRKLVRFVLSLAQ